LLAGGVETRLTGTIIEEGLRGAGGHLLDGEGQRFMARYDPKEERATRDIVSRAMFEEMRAGRTGPNGGLFMTMRHLDAAMVRRDFKGMVERCRDVGFDLVSGLVEVVPTAHYMMGGVRFGLDCRTDLPGLFAAGEDTGGVHGANRLGGNGVANSTVFGGIAGEAMAAWVPREGMLADPDQDAIDAALKRTLRPLDQPPGDLNGIRERLYRLMWEDVGIIRDGDGLRAAAEKLDGLADELQRVGVATPDRRFNLTWQDWLNLESQLLVSRAICAAALAREDSRGAHFRTDFPATGSLEQSANTICRQDGRRIAVTTAPVAFTHVRPGQSLIEPAETAAE
jgi:fumarate reductase flavoprotein subunit